MNVNQANTYKEEGCEASGTAQTSCVNVSGPSSVLLLVSSSASAFSPSQSLARTDYGMAKVERMEHELAASNPFQSAVERMSSDREISALLSECRHNKWGNVLNRVNKNHSLAVAKLPLENHITTTILHQAITSKGNTTERATLILRILEVAPEAAGIPNGYASYPIHCLAQRNTKMNASTKETLLLALMKAFPGALLEQNIQGKRTPLHILFTDYVSPKLTQAMIDMGPSACFIKDKKGYLPAHIACSRHCSPEKLHLLLQVNPDALFATTNDKHTLLSLAVSTATKSHPNKTLIEALTGLLLKHDQGKMILDTVKDYRMKKLPARPRVARCVPIKKRVTFQWNPPMSVVSTDASVDEAPVCAHQELFMNMETGDTAVDYDDVMFGSDAAEAEAGLLLQIANLSTPFTEQEVADTLARIAQV